MKRLLVLSWVCLALCSLQALPQDDKVAEEDKKFTGTWIVTSMEFGGNKVDEANYKEMTFTFKGKNYEQKQRDQLIEGGKQDLDPSKKPMHMDITVTDGDTKGKKQLAIYEWDGSDKVKICAADHDDTTRPAKFETKEGSRSMIFELKRKKD